MYLQPLYYLVGLLLINGFIGFGTSLLFYKGPLLKRILLSPILSYALITLSTAYLSYLGIGTKQFSVPLFIVWIVIATIGLLTKSSELQPHERKSSRLLFPIILFCTLNGLLVLGAPLLDHASGVFNDHTTYISISEYLRDSGYSQPAELTTPFWENHTRMYQEHHFRMGAQFFVSVFAALFQTAHTIQIYPALLGLIAFIFMMAMSFLYLSIRQAKPNIWELSLVLFFSLIAINLNSQNLVIGFLPQTCGIILFITLTALLYEAFHQNKTSLITSALLFAALVFTYHEITLFYCAGVVIFCLFELLYKKNHNYSLFLKIAGTHTAALVLSPIGTREFFFGIQSSSQSNDVGWNVPNSLLRYFQGLLGQDIHYILPNTLERYITIPGLIATFFIGYVLIKHILMREEKSLIHFISTFFLPFAGGLWFFAYLTLNPFNKGLGHTWRIFKLMSWGYWIIPLIIGLAMFAYIKDSKLKKYLLALVIISLLPSVTGNIYAQYVNQKNGMELYTNNYTDPLNDFEYIATNKDHYTPANIINHVSHPAYPYLLLSILKDTSVGDLNIYSVKLTPSTAPQYFPWIHYRREHSSTGSLLKTKAGFHIYASNSSFVYLDKGFSTRETSPKAHFAWMTEKTGTIRVLVPQGAKAQFTTEISSWSTTPEQVEISLNNSVVFSAQVNDSTQQFTSPQLESGFYEFKINYSGELRKKDQTDGRTLSLMFKNITISKIIQQ